MLELNVTPPPTVQQPFKASPSSLALFQACPRKFYHRYCNGIESKAEPDDNLKFGTAVHAALEHNANKPVATWSVREALAGLDADLSSLAAGTIAAYGVHWAGSLRYAAVELKLETELRNSRLTLVTILDGVAETEAGERVVVDHKTTTRIEPGSWFWEKLALDRQATTYLWASRIHGYGTEHALWDAIRRPSHKRRTEATPAEFYTRRGKWGAAGDTKPGTGIPAESPGQFATRVRDSLLAEPAAYFQRGPVYRRSDELDAGMAEVDAIGAQILDCFDRDEWPTNPQGCFSYGRRCEYFDICAGAASPTDSTLYQLRKAR